MRYHFSYFYLKIYESLGFKVYGKIILQFIHEFQRDFPRKLQHSVGLLKVTNLRVFQMFISVLRPQVMPEVD